MQTPWTIETFLRNWFNKNETLANATTYRQATARALKKEIAAQKSKRAELVARINKLKSDVVDADKLMATLEAEYKIVSKG